jgi:ABC-type transport system involved in cytochrome c biogenesis permease subunit
VLLLIAAMLSRLPILGSPSVFTFVIGVITLVLTIERLYGRTAGLRIGSIQLWPGMWFMIALLSIGTALTWLGTMLAVMPSVVTQGRAKRISTLLAYPLAAAFGFIPLFIYCAWLGHQIGTF